MTAAETKWVAELEAAESELAKELTIDGDIVVRALAKLCNPENAAVFTNQDRLAARVGYLRELVRRNERRSDNA